MQRVPPTPHGQRGAAEKKPVQQRGNRDKDKRGRSRGDKGKVDEYI